MRKTNIWGIAEERNSERIPGEVRPEKRVSDSPAVFQRAAISGVPAPRAGNAAEVIRTKKWPLKGATRKSRDLLTNIFRFDGVGSQIKVEKEE